MKRYALLFGNTNDLPGITKDLIGWKKFLTSDIGGAWRNDEILVLEDVSIVLLNNVIRAIKHVRKPDFLIVVYSGHSGYEDNKLILEINKDRETIDANELKHLAKRQINVFDSCRSVEKEEPLTEGINRFTLTDNGIKSIREAYDDRIMQAYEQNVSLYACSKGGYARDSKEGGYYIKNLLKAARKIDIGEKYLTVGHVHMIAAMATAEEVKIAENETQTPDACLPKLPVDKQLILSINPRMIKPNRVL